jgi:hypothetical protein
MLCKCWQEVLIMHHRITTSAIAALLVCLGIGGPTIQAQETCSLKTMAGTYAFYERGSSLILDPSAPSYPVHWSGAVAHFVTVGEVTFTPDGLGEGFYWIRIGSLNGGFDPIPVQVQITEMNVNCTGKFRYTVNLPGVPPATIEERFIAFDNGREYRSLPTFIDENGVPTLAWIGAGRRIRKPSEPVSSCGPQSVHGTYVISAENVLAFDPTSAFADTILFRMDIAMTGDYTGMLYEKLGPLSVELPVSGEFTVNPDCSFSWDLNLVINDVPATVGIRGVLFDEGKELYGLAMDEGIAYSFAQGVRVNQEPDRGRAPVGSLGHAVSPRRPY